MRAFKHLIPLADVAVGFLGLFFIIFTVTRPDLNESVAQAKEREKTVRQLQEKIRELEKLHLASAHSGKPLAEMEAASITLTENEIRVNLKQRETVFANSGAFQSAAAKIDWPPEVVLYIDQRIPFARVVVLIDALKQVQDGITVRIAALAHPN